MFPTKVSETIKTHNLCLIISFPEIGPFEIMWENMADAGTPYDNIIRL